jgi:putative hydrolase of the HAD superfamily
LKTYQHIFFDLDHTLWDYEGNAGEALQELYDHHDLGTKGMFSKAELIRTFFDVNDMLWDDYNHHRIQRKDLRERRFPTIFKRLGLPLELRPKNIENEYIALSPTKDKVFDHAHELLDYLSTRYELHIITNGFNDIQSTKMASSKIDHYFKAIITSETAGFRKPDPRIFQLALDMSGAVVSDSLMIGDNLRADIGGARDFGMDQVFFNPGRKSHTAQVTYEVARLKELMSLL